VAAEKGAKLEWLRGERLLLGAFLTLLAVAALSAWNNMPIYPDEIAFRLQMGRYIQDQGAVRGLYALCASNAKETPLLFVIPAWAISWLDLTYSLVDARVLPFFTILTAVVLAVLSAVRGVSPNAAAVATTAFIGVAGSGLILARYEFVHALNIVCCLGAFHFLESGSTRPSLRYGLFALLLTSSLLSLYVHVQGLLFFPLTLYFVYQVVRPGLGRTQTGLMTIILFVLMVQAAIRLHDSSCGGYPEIEQFWARMTFNLQELESVNLGFWLDGKFYKYLLSFQYRQNYAIGYLPGIAVLTVGDGWERSFLAALNLGIRIIVSMNLLLSGFAAIGASVLALGQYRRGLMRHQPAASWTAKGLGGGQALALVLLVLPIMFLFLYDSAQNFYRSFFLNFLAALLLAVFLSRLEVGRARPLATLYFGLCGAVVLVSLAVNAWWFTDRLRDGYEGPSLSLNRNWGGIRRDVEALSQACNMDLRKGRIILDDTTYDSLRRYPILYPITYLALQAEVAGISMSEVIARVQPNYALARCDVLRNTKLGYQHQRGLLCCQNFSEAGSDRQ